MVPGVLWPSANSDDGLGVMIHVPHAYVSFGDIQRIQVRISSDRMIHPEDTARIRTIAFWESRWHSKTPPSRFSWVRPVSVATTTHYDARVITITYAFQMLCPEPGYFAPSKLSIGGRVVSIPPIPITPLLDEGGGDDSPPSILWGEGGSPSTHASGGSGTTFIVWGIIGGIAVGIIIFVLGSWLRWTMGIPEPARYGLSRRMASRIHMCRQQGRKAHHAIPELQSIYQTLNDALRQALMGASRDPDMGYCPLPKLRRKMNMLLPKQDYDQGVFILTACERVMFQRLPPTYPVSEDIQRLIDIVRVINQGKRKGKKDRDVLIESPIHGSHDRESSAHSYGIR